MSEEPVPSEEYEAIPPTVAEFLRPLIQSKDWSVRRLAREAGIDGSRLNQVFTGERPISDQASIFVSLALGLELHEVAMVQKRRAIYEELVRMTVAREQPEPKESAKRRENISGRFKRLVRGPHA